MIVCLDLDFPAARRFGQQRALVDASVAADHAANPHDLPEHVLFDLHARVERFSELGFEPDAAHREPDREVAVAERTQRSEQLAILSGAVGRMRTRGTV